MSQQTWPLSQSANKSSGTCSVCFAVRQLHGKDSHVHLHGPRNNRCPGSRKPPMLPSTTSPLSSSLPVSTSHSSTNISLYSPLISPSNTSSIQPPCSFVPSADQSQNLTGSPVNLSAGVTFSHPSINVPIIKHIPKSARPACCTFLSGLLNNISRASTDLTHWSSLFSFGLKTLQVPPRGGKRHNLCSIIKKRVDVSSSGSATNLDSDRAIAALPRRHLDATSSFAAAVQAKIEDGNIRAALRIISSDDKPAVDNSDTFAKLSEKHPVSACGGSIPSLNPGTAASFQASEADVLKAIRSFPAGSSGGPDGIRPQHIADLVNCKEQGPNLLSSITSFINNLLDGKCPTTVRPVLFGGSLIALDKKSGGIRPIAVGYTWRRIAAKCANSFAAARLGTYLRPHQLGVAVPGGCEAAVHATRRFTDVMPHGHAVVKLDFSNAFNSIHRSIMLNAVFLHVPEIYKFCHLSYGDPSFLKFNSQVISSQEGAQQGDPLGPLLFCLAIHPILTSFTSELVIGYMDDITLGGDEESLARDVQLTRVQGEAMGLKLNVKKCEFISHTALSTDSTFSEFIHLKPTEAILLGAPLINGCAMDVALSSRCDDLALAIDRLKLLAAHDALVLLRASFSAPKILHTLRSSPCAGHPALDRFDGLLKNGVSQIANSNLSDLQWIQASLPVKVGGLGIRRVASLAPSAFLASAASTLDLQEYILSRSTINPDQAVAALRELWSSTYNLPCPAAPLASKQHSWDKPSLDIDSAAVLAGALDNHHRARVLAVSAPHAGDWLYALPISNCGLRLDDETIRVAVGLRLGINLCQPHPCNCGTRVDSRGTHGLACKLSSGRMARHHHINDLIWRALQRASIPSIKEPAGLSRSDGKRPDGLTLIPWEGGKCLIWDVTVADTLAASHLATTSRVTGGAAESAGDKKDSKYSSLTNTYTFIPVACETMGPLNSKALSFLALLGRRISAVSGDSRESSFLFQRISVAVQRFNCVCFRGSFVTPLDIEG